MQALGIGEQASQEDLSSGPEGVSKEPTGQAGGRDRAAAVPNGCVALTVQENGAPDRPDHEGCPSQC